LIRFYPAFEGSISGVDFGDPLPGLLFRSIPGAAESAAEAFHTPAPQSERPFDLVSHVPSFTLYISILK
jgi:hypothetical protein